MLFVLVAGLLNDVKRIGTSFHHIVRLSRYKNARDICDLWDKGQQGPLAKMLQSLLILNTKMEHKEYWYYADKFCSHFGGAVGMLSEDDVKTLQPYCREISRTSFASGSVAHIFLAMTKDGEKIVIKVRHKDLEKTHAFVSRFIDHFISFSKNRTGLSNNKALVHVINVDFAKEYDLNEEFKKTQILWKLFQNDPDIQVTKPFLSGGIEWVALQYMNGQTLPHFMLTQKPSKLDRERIFYLLFKFFIKTIKHGYLYSDFNPGNFLIARRKGKVFLQVIDSSGLVPLTPTQSVALLQFFTLKIPHNWSLQWPKNCSSYFERHKSFLKHFFMSFGSKSKDLDDDEKLKYLWRLFSTFTHPMVKNQTLPSSYVKDKASYKEHITKNMPKDVQGPPSSLLLLRVFDYVFALYYRLEVEMNLYKVMEEVCKS